MSRPRRHAKFVPGEICVCQLTRAAETEAILNDRKIIAILRAAVKPICEACAHYANCKADHEGMIAYDKEHSQ